MTYQEVLWKDKYIWVVSIMTKNKRIHRYLKQYCGRVGHVVGEAKNGMLLVEFGFGSKRHLRCIPSSCVVQFGVVVSRDFNRIL
jgi:hypothetical protein